jgi:hypothetical protein
MGNENSNNVQNDILEYRLMPLFNSNIIYIGKYSGYFTIVIRDEIYLITQVFYKKNKECYIRSNIILDNNKIGRDGFAIEIIFNETYIKYICYETTDGVSGLDCDYKRKEILSSSYKEINDVNTDYLDLIYLKYNLEKKPNCLVKIMHNFTKVK